MAIDSTTTFMAIATPIRTIVPPVDKSKKILSSELQSMEA